jgi:PAS domain S-box-containing protein
MRAADLAIWFVAYCVNGLVVAFRRVHYGKSEDLELWLRNLMINLRIEPEQPGRATWFGGYGLYAPVWHRVLVLVFCSLIAPATAQPDAKSVSGKSVLVVNTFSDLNLDNVRYIESAMRARVPGPVNFYVEYLESWRLGDAGYEKAVFQTLEHEYVGQKLDLVSAVSYPALRFVLKYRDLLFPGVPIVFWGVDASRIPAQERWPGVAGVTETVDVQGTIDLALHLHPKTNTVAIITNNSDFDRYWLGAVHKELLRHQDKVREIDLVALPTDQLFEKVNALPPQTIVLFQPSPQESVQPAMGIYDILSVVGQRFPTYCIMPIHCVNHGGIGGVATDMETQAASAAEISRRIFSGERPENIPISHDSGSRARLDWLQLQRWHIPEAALPPGSLVFNRQPTLWERYRAFILAGIVVIVVQLLLIAGLLWQRARKRKAEAVLRESEKRFRVMADTTPSLVWMCDAKGRTTYLNERRVAFTGPDPEAGYGESWIEYIHPDDLRNVKDGMSQGLKDKKAFSREYRLRRSDGAYRWMFDVASPRLNGDGSFAGFIGSAIDVTDQKMAQQALEQVSGQLIEAQEKERSRIARDLHDDICQRLALLSMELDQANRSVNELSDVAKLLKEIRQHCSEIAGDVQSLSHELHSSRLDYLGITAAIRGFCHEFSKQHEVTIEFTDKDVPVDLSREVSLCLFRVAQEALHNAVKYSGVNEYRVELSATAEEVQLVVGDSGRGFDLEATKGNRGLGLVSMQERVHLVRGSLQVESNPGRGTKIGAVVPRASRKEASLEDIGIEEPEGVAGAI